MPVSASVTGRAGLCVAAVLAAVLTFVPATTAVWGSGWAQRALVVLPGSPGELQALIGDE